MEKPIKTTFNNLPKDIIFDIFSRIPLKILYQLRCVCKKWQFLLDFNLEFRGFYHQKHKISPILVFKQQNIDTLSTKLATYFIDGTQIHQFSTNFPHLITSILSCNAILCLISNHKILLYDPIIKRASNLPNSSDFSSTFSYAFGFSSFRNVFKLLHFYTIEKFDNFHYCQVKEVMCEIISCQSSQLGLNSHENWRFLGKCPYNILSRKNYAHVCGKIYWLIVEKKFNPNCVKIMFFDVEIESFGVTCFPRTYSNRSIECLELIEIRDELCLIDRLPWESSMNVWMMKMNEEVGLENYWVKIYEIDLMGIVHHDVRILGHLGEIGGNYCGSGSESESKSESKSEGEILIKVGEQSFGFYELESQVFKELGDKIKLQGWNLEMMIDRKRLL